MTLLRSLLIALVIVVVAAGGTAWLLMSSSHSNVRVSEPLREGVGAVVPLGYSAGEPPALSATPTNPLGDSPTAIQEGKKLYRSMNCAGCHGYDAKGGMGPDLTDHAWRYGGAPIDIYKSIYEGRPQGMPAWGTALPPQTIWQVVSYLASLGGVEAAPANQVANQGQGAQAGQNP